MRPISLEMEGFTSFRERVAIDFSSLDLFAITGPTGAGKTSIIDAMTYALYGCTPRIGEKQVSELISQGLNRMIIQLVFSSGKNEYRVARVGKWTGKQMNTDIRFEQRSGEEWIPLADGVQKAKPLIEQIVGLDFNGFTKSVVLPQGRFDEFLKGRADDRRKILSDLLDLAIYRRMMQRANALHNDHKAQTIAIGDMLQKEYAEATPERLSKLRQSLDETVPQLEPVDLLLKQTAQFLPMAHALRQARCEFSRAEAELKGMGPQRKVAEDRLKQVQKAVAELDRSLSTVTSGLQKNTYDQVEHLRVSALLEKAQRLESVLERFEQTEQMRKEHTAHTANLDLQMRELQTRGRETDQACSDCRKDLERDRTALVQLQEKYGSPDAVQAAIETRKQLSKEEKTHGKLESELKANGDERKTLDKKLAVALADAAVTRGQRDLARSEYETLLHSHSAESLKPGLRIGEACPVCEQTIGRLPKTRRHQPLEKARQRLDDAEKASGGTETRVASLQARVGPLDREAASLFDRIAESDQSIREYAHRLSVFGTADLADLKQQLEAARRQAEASAKRFAELDAASKAASIALKDQQHRRALLQKDIDVTAQQLAKLQTESDRLRDDLGSFANLKKVQAEAAKQEHARTERERLNADRDRLTQEMSRAKDDVARAMADLQGLEATHRKVQEMIQKLESRIEEHTATLHAEFPQLKRVYGERDEAFQLEQQSRDLQSSRDAIQKKLFELEGQIRSLEGKIVRAAEMREQLEGHKCRMAVAKLLHNALQGDEFIAFIQEEAYVRLAVDGSVHLKILSADRYSFSVKRDEFHVVDHWNADEPRPVATLSGGESFLASLALALALAEGLSGLSSGHNKFALESLFLDEGFGTLDPETLEYVVAGIEGLSGNNRLIGIISHIPELADRMPARIQVTKSVGGSSISCGA